MNLNSLPSPIINRLICVQVCVCVYFCNLFFSFFFNLFILTLNRRWCWKIFHLLIIFPIQLVIIINIFRSKWPSSSIYGSSSSSSKIGHCVTSVQSNRKKRKERKKLFLTAKTEKKKKSSFYNYNLFFIIMIERWMKSTYLYVFIISWTFFYLVKYQLHLQSKSWKWQFKKKWR